MKKIFIAILCLSGSLYVQGQGLAKGKVFEDKNGNRKTEKGEKGLSGIAVSNGRDIVITDKDGNYQLPVGKDNIIFVIKPEGYRFLMDENNHPEFFYLYKPEGAPSSFKYQGAAATGILPAAINFGLVPAQEQGSFTALVFGDPQPYNMEEVEFFDKAIIGETKDIQGIAFGLSLGDLVGDSLDLHIPYAQTVKKVGIPWYQVMGNHDMNYEAEADSLSDETFEKNFGPANYSFNYGKSHFIVLDDILYPDPRDKKGYWGGFRPDQLEFLKNDLRQVSKDKLVVISFHIPLFTNKEEDAFRREDRQQFFNLLRDYPNVLVLSAHTHLQRHNFYDSKDGWEGIKPLHEYNAGTTSGDWYSGELNEAGVPVSTMRDGTPKGYAFLKVEGNQYKIDYKVAGKPKEYQIAIFNPKVVPYGKRTSSGIYANFFMGSDKDKVQYRIDNGDWMEMEQVTNADPSFLDKLHRWDFTDKLMPGRRPSNAVNCNHLWRGDIPTRLQTGNHSIEVKATDMFGQEFTAGSNYTIETNATTE